MECIQKYFMWQFAGSCACALLSGLQLKFLRCTKSLSWYMPTINEVFLPVLFQVEHFHLLYTSILVESHYFAGHKCTQG